MRETMTSALRLDSIPVVDPSQVRCAGQRGCSADCGAAPRRWRPCGRCAWQVGRLFPCTADISANCKQMLIPHSKPLSLPPALPHNEKQVKGSTHPELMHPDFE